MKGDICMRKITKVGTLAMTIIMGMNLCGCGTVDKENVRKKEQEQKTRFETEKPEEKQRVATEEDKEMFVDGVNDFSYELFKKMADGENLVISPYSVAMALSMVDVGARGETKEELEQVLGIKDLDGWNSGVKWYLDREFGEHTKVRNANSLWMDEVFSLSDGVEESFMHVLTDYYNACVEQRNLHTDDTREAINQWAAEHTEDMIPEIYKENIQGDVQMLLMNAIYFEGKWQNAFLKKDTHKQKFYGTKGNTMVDMMHQYGKSYRYIEYGNLHAMELPYEDDTVVMDIIMRQPVTCGTGRLTTLEYWNGLTKEEKQEFFETISTSNYEEFSEIAIPKFEMEWGQSMVEELKQMGIIRAFEEDADFSDISSGLFIGDVFQKAKVIVDEAGTKAAAVTVVEMRKDAIVEEKRNFIVQEPFVFVIRDVETGAILFMGDVENMGA